VSDALDVGIASAPLHGGPATGDLAVLAPRPDGHLVAAIDGLGHGPHAQDAACAIAAEVERASADDPLSTVFARCHTAAAATRGAAMTLAAFDHAAERMTWLAVGNVAAVLVRGGGGRRESVVARPGIVGAHLPPLRATEVGLQAGDVVVMATDGVGTGFASAVRPGEASQPAAERLLSVCATGADDALVVVVRPVGWSAP
jgi:phosphoserine phosphatase RsbX